MLHKMSEIRGWSHNEMMQMPKALFYRYYGYWYRERLEEKYEIEKAERERKKKERGNQPRNWKKY